MPAAGRDAALTWDVPPPLDDAAAAAAEARHAFAAVAGKHLEALVRQLLEGEGLCVAGVEQWAPLVCRLAQAAASALSPPAAAAHGTLDPRHYIKVKRIVSPGAVPADSSLLLGVACRKSLTHKRMRGAIAQPRIMLLAGGLEAQASGAGAAATRSSGGLAGLGGGGGAAAASAQSSLSSFESLMDQEQRYLAAAVERIAALRPDVLVVERSVARYAQELLLARDVSLVLNVKPELLERLARCTGAQVAPSVDQLTSHCIGFCKEFEVESVASQAPQGGGGGSAPPTAPCGTEPSPRTGGGAAADAQHLVTDCPPNQLRRLVTLTAAAQGGGPRALMLFRGCPRPLGSTILLHGTDGGELAKVKRVASFASYAAYWGQLEAALLSDQLAAAAAAVLPGGGGQPEALAGLADAMASTSYLSTAEARGRQAILSASPHVSVVLERGAAAEELELPAAAAADKDDGGSGGSGGGGAEGDEWEEGSPVSPASSADSAGLWVLPAEAAAATFTVSGSQSQAELEEAGGQQAAAAGRTVMEQQEAEAGTANGSVHGGVAAPESPQDPLHLAAKELALQLLHDDSPGADAALAAAAAALGTDASEPMQPPQSGSARSEAPPGVAAAAAAAAVAAEAAAAAPPAPVPPGLRAYTSQQLWLAISCKNPAKGILCEPAHSHCMEFYADTDLPLASFLSAAAPSHRKCPHPQCGEGAPLHLRSFLHAHGLVTLSSVRLPAGRELPDGAVWLWLRPTGGRGEERGARVALSPEAACLSFAHLLSLLFDARRLALGGLSLQRDFVRYLGAGSTLLCLHFSPAPAYAVCMPPRQLDLLPQPELEWLQEEVKQLTEEADEAFGAIEFALEGQLRALEQQGGGGGAASVAGAAVSSSGSSSGVSTALDPEFRQMWLDTLADTRASFLELVQDTVSLLDCSVPLAADTEQDGQQQAAEAGAQQAQQAQQALQVVPVVWELNRLRSMLAAVVLQWATCLHEGAAGNNATPPSGGSMLSTVLATRRQATGRHSRRGSLAEEEGGADPLLLSPSRQAAEQQAAEQQVAAAATQQQQPEAGPSLQQQPPPGEPPPGARHALARSTSGGSLGQQFVETAGSLAAGAGAASELDFGAPSLVGGDEPGGSASLSTSPGAGGAPLPSFIPTGLVARYVAMFDPSSQRADGGSGRGGGSAPSSPPKQPASRSQRTLSWVQASAQQPAAVGADAAAGGAAGDGSVQLPAQAQQEQEEAPAAGPLPRQRLALFRLDLTHPDPELVQALTPGRTRSTEEAELSPTTVGSRLEQISARLGRMSLMHSFTERRRSGALVAPAPADPQSLAPVAEQQQQQQQQQQHAAASAAPEPDQQPALQQQQQQQQQAGEDDAAAGEEHPPAPSPQVSGSHFEEWSALLSTGAPAEGDNASGPAVAAVAAPDSCGGEGEGGALAGHLRRNSPLKLLKTASSGPLEAIAKLEQASMPAVAAAPAAASEAPDAAAAAPLPSLSASAPAGLPSEHSGSLPVLAASQSSRLGPLSQLSASLGSLTAPSAAAPSTAPPPLPEKAPSKLRQLLSKLRAEPRPRHVPLTAGHVVLSGRALLPGGADGARLVVFDDEPSSLVAYFLATREYQQYLHNAVATILFGEAGQRSGAGGTSSGGAAAAASGGGGAAGASGAGEAAVPGSWQSAPASPSAGGAAAAQADRRGSSLVPALQVPQAGATEGRPAAADAAGAAAAAGPPTAPPSSRTVTQEELAAEQSGDWQVLFHEQQLDCQLALEDPSPGMPWGRARLQVTAFYAPQFAELRRRCVGGGEAAFLASISRCRKWASRGGKSAAYFARSCDKRYIVKQLSRSERQSFLEFAPDYFRYVATMLHRGQDTCLAKILGVFTVSVAYTGGRGAPGAPAWGGKEGGMDLLVTENIFYGRDAQVSRIYDLKGSQRDRYAADDPGAAGAVLLDENLQELNLSLPTLVGPHAYARLQRALWSDTSFLASLGVMDYSLLVGVDRRSQELVVGVIDYCRQYTWDKQVETWVKKSGILGGAGKDPTVISPKQYSRRFRIAMSSYLTVVPSWEAPEPPLDPDAM